MNKTAAQLFFVQYYVGIITPSVGADPRVCPYKYNMDGKTGRHGGLPLQMDVLPSPLGEGWGGA